jgi:hypothetical protein
MITDCILDTPAYTSVPAMQSFGYHPPPMPHYPPPAQYNQVTVVDPPPPKPTKIQWPLSVRQYVQRSFEPANMATDVTKGEIEAKLKEVITAATDNDQLLTIDWTNLPLPQQLIRMERAQGSTRPWGNGPNEALKPIVVYPPPAHDVPSRKRKSQDFENTGAGAAPPWRNTNIGNGFEGRVSYATSHATAQMENIKLGQNESKSNSKSQKNMEKRQRKMDGGYKSTYQRSPSPDPNAGPVVGTCTDLEKRYLRLTAPPKPETVRPLHILKQTLELLKKKWRKESNYSYICDQFKSLRQDLTVQRIKEKFTVEVYEIHARIALEKGDLGEYNQCQTQLRALYAQRLGGNPTEFKAYRILYFIHTCNRTALNDILTELTTAEKEDPAIKHALDARSALALGNYHKFFRLYLETPNMGAYLMDMFVVRERLAALSNICRA